jgi:hypothetical protein
MRSGCIASVDQLGYFVGRQRHAVFVAELAQICRRRDQRLRHRTVAESVGAMA